MVRKFLFVAVAALLAVGVVRFFAGRKTAEEPPPSDLRTSDVLPQATATIGDNVFSVEIAETPESQTQGLSGRVALGEDEGMLFVFSGKAPQTFWMKGMRFPLDFVWIADGKVIGLTENAPADDGLLTYGSPEPADMVLEINTGEVRRLGIKVGDAVSVTHDTVPAQ